jgi:hypothetical protein
MMSRDVLAVTTHYAKPQRHTHRDAARDRREDPVSAWEIY